MESNRKKPRLERLWVALSLLIAVTTAMADDSDPFPNPNPHDYVGNMIVVGTVAIGDANASPGTIVAAYAGDEIRGKVIVPALSASGTPKPFFMFVYGSNSGAPLHFKVFTEGKVVEVDQGLTYTFNGLTGGPRKPYVIQLPTPVVTTPSSEGWATVCLSYNAEVPDGVTVWNVTDIVDGELVMASTTGSILPAGTPALLQSSGLASYEWLPIVSDGDIAFDSTILSGTTESTDVGTHSVLTLGHNDVTGEIGFWSFTNTTIPANRAYIVADGTDWASGARMGTTGIMEVEDDCATGEEVIYDLQGRKYEIDRMSDHSLPRGLYIVGNRKVIVR